MKRNSSQGKAACKRTKIQYNAVAQRETPTDDSAVAECQRQIKGAQGAIVPRIESQEKATAVLEFQNVASESGVVSINDAAVSAPVLSKAPIPPNVIFPPMGRSTLVLPAGSSVTISATAPTTITIHVEGPSEDATHPSASLVDVPSAPLSQDLSYLMDSKPEHAPICQAPLPLSDLKPESTLSSSLSNRKTIEIWCHGVARAIPEERAGAGAVVTIQPDNKTFHVRQVLNGTQICIDLQGFSTNQVQYSAIVLALKVSQDYLRQQPLGTRLDSLQIHGDLELIVKQLKGYFECKSPALLPYYLQIFGMFRQCIDTYMAPWTQEEIRRLRLRLHPDVQVLHIPREDNHIAQALAKEAMDQQQSWMTQSDDGHQQRYPLPES